MTTFAGLYTDTVTYPSGASAPNVAVSVFPHGSVTLAALFTDNTKSVAGPNPVSTDVVGNLSFYAAPGFYDCTTASGGAFTVLVGVDPADVAAGGVGPAGATGAAGAVGATGPQGPAGSGGAGATITWSGGAYALRSTVTVDTTVAVTWAGPVPPTVGGGYLLPVDVWLNTGGSV